MMIFHSMPMSVRYAISKAREIATSSKKENKKKNIGCDLNPDNGNNMGISMACHGVLDLNYASCLMLTLQR
jgi:hypothetical protein